MPGDGRSGAGLFAPVVTTDAILELTSGSAWVRAMLDVEAALARVEERLDVVPAGTADAIGRACATGLDPDELGRAARGGGNPVIPLVAELRRRAGDAADWVHFGATSQDVLDSASMLVAARTLAAIDEELTGLGDACAGLSEAHRATLMVARTLLQHALPTTFGLKAAGWLTAAAEGRTALRQVRDRLPVQLGGAAGTLASLGERGSAVAAALAAELGLTCPPLPWHTDRTVVAELAATLGMVTGVAAKISWDVALLMQTEVAEAAEPPVAGRGGSSTLPHKRNPVAAAAVSSAHRQASALVSVVLAAMPDEHERGLGGWQAEWETLTSLLRLAGGAAAHARETAAGLVIDAGAMGRNLGRTGGVLLSERIVLELAPALGRTEATRAVQEAASSAASSERSFADALLAHPVLAPHLRPDRVAELLDPRGYLGSSDAFIDAALKAYRDS
ncbi:MAG: 3-carboxy-cis,cis-muconate cycloisomerase [Acidimicrobiales bacterium]